jgi:CxxC motif-containing protein
MAESIPEGEKTVRCIVCPTGCEIHVKNVNGEIIVEGHTCKRGEEYAKTEFIAPKRILTSTMRVNNGLLPLIPIRTSEPVLKEKLNEILKEIAIKIVDAPIKMGDILIENVLDLGVNIIASRDLIKV